MKQTAFTLIELLVVIVIIGILATISTATFKEHFLKASNLDRTTKVKQYREALRAYFTVYGTYPPIAANDAIGSGHACLGENLQYEGMVPGTCRIPTGGTIAYEDSIFNQEIKKFMDKLPIVTMPSDFREWNGNLFQGAVVRRINLIDKDDYDAAPDKTIQLGKPGYVLAYYLLGPSQECLDRKNIKWTQYGYYVKLPPGPQTDYNANHHGLSRNDTLCITYLDEYLP